MSRPLYHPTWDVRFSEPDETPAEWTACFRSASERRYHSGMPLTMPCERQPGDYND
jgi:hypothetical protein